MKRKKIIYVNKHARKRNRALNPDSTKTRLSPSLGTMRRKIITLDIRKAKNKGKDLRT